jgi:VanZ family protein
MGNFLSEAVKAAMGSTWWKAAAGICLALIVVLSLVPQDERVATGLPGKIEHIIAYGVTALLLGLSTTRKNGPALVALNLAWIAGAIEILQLWSPGRHPRVSDAIVGAAAGALGAAVAAWLRRTFQPAP